jgi:hypothetical protein
MTATKLIIKRRTIIMNEIWGEVLSRVEKEVWVKVVVGVNGRSTHIFNQVKQNMKL